MTIVTLTYTLCFLEAVTTTSQPVTLELMMMNEWLGVVIGMLDIFYMRG